MQQNATEVVNSPIYPSIINPQIAQPMPEAMARQFAKALSPEKRAAFKQRQQEIALAYEREEERKKNALWDLLSREELFRFSYVPFVIAKLVWDYADSILNLAAYMKIQKAKPLGRAIRELKRDYDGLRAPYIDMMSNDREEENMYIFEENVNDLFKLYFVNLRCDLQSEYPALEDEWITFLIAVYQCHIVLQALYRFVDKQSAFVAKKVNHRIGDILPEPLRKLNTIVLAYVGDKPMSKQFQKQQNTYISALANRMALIGLNDIQEP